MDWSKNTNAATETVEKAINLYPGNEQALMLAAKISSITDAPVAGKYADDLTSQVLSRDPDNKDAMLYALKGLIKRDFTIIASSPLHVRTHVLQEYQPKGLYPG